MENKSINIPRAIITIIIIFLIIIYSMEKAKNKLIIDYESKIEDYKTQINSQERELEELRFKVQDYETTIEYLEDELNSE